MLTNLLWYTFCSIYIVYQIIMLYTNANTNTNTKCHVNDICQLCLNKTGEKKDIKGENYGERRKQPLIGLCVCDNALLT